MTMRYPFTRRMLEGAPRDAGVYRLWRGEQLLYVGRADGGAVNIQSRLLEHLEGRFCPCSRDATHYSWEIVVHPRARELELLQQHGEAAGVLPPCNLHVA